MENRPVFYSLGNFVFDRQAFPKTDEGLLVGIVASANRLTFQLFPIKNKVGQPALMSQKEAKLFLKNLAQKSDIRLYDNIKKGIIEIKREQVR